MKLTPPTERLEQVALCKFLRTAGITHFTVANGERVSKRRGQQRKFEGVVAGAPDVMVALPGRPALAIEMKRTKGGTVSPEQAVMHERLRAAGWVVVVARGAMAAIDAVIEHRDKGLR